MVKCNEHNSLKKFHFVPALFSFRASTFTFLSKKRVYSSFLCHHLSSLIRFKSQFLFLFYPCGLKFYCTYLLQLRQAKDDIVTASKVAYRFLAGVTSRPSATPENASNSNNGGSRFQGAWFRNLISPGARPSSSTHPEDSSSSDDDEFPLEHRKLTEHVQSDLGRSI